MNNNKINGIDVSECKYLNKVINEEPYCNIDEEHLCTCSSDENCYFKQLKRLQEENEELRQNWRLDCLKCEYKNTKTDVDKYKQALEKTLKILCNGRTFYEGYFDNPNLSRTDEAIKVIDGVLK